MHIARYLALTLAVAGTASAQAQPTPFDGRWNVVLSCPAHNASDDDAKGYTHRFPADVENGRLRGTYGKEGEPGWQHLHGKLNDDGSATLRIDGIVNSPSHAIRDAPRGKEYSYRIKAQFQATRGTGQRLTGRMCEFTFSR